MRKWSKKLILSLLFISMLFPLIPFDVKAQSKIPTFTVGAAGPAPIGNWDGTSFGASIGDKFRYNALEGLFDLPYSAETGEYDNLAPILATNWTIHSRPDEMNAAGFMNYDGVDYMDITLRENVKFHDGSDWNATVCKWNLDRHMYTLGSINYCLGSAPDSAVTGNRPIYWMSIADWAPYATASWNVTKLRGPLGIPSIGYLNTYPDFGNSYYLDIPFGYNRFPRFTNITILDNKQSGGTVRVYFNDWGTGPQYLSNAWIRFISMKSYQDYFDVPIMGYGDVPGFPQNNVTSPFPGHLIGTGPYMFDNFSIDTGTMTRFDGWWNASAQQAKGWHMVPKVAVVAFSHDETGYGLRTTALVTGDIDFAYDHSWEPLEYSELATATNLEYIDMGQENYGEIIRLNAVDETYLRYWYDIGFNLTQWNIYASSNIQYANGTLKPAHGVDRAFRKALSYAYDYDTYLALFNGRLVRSGGLVAATHEYYDPSVNLPSRDLTLARQTLLDDPVWGPICNSHGLFTTTDDWNTVAGTNPIYTFEYHYDQAHLESYSILISSLEDIGCAIDATEDIMGTYPAILAGTLPVLSNDGFAIKSYHDRINNLGYLSAYYQSTGIIERTPSGATFPYVPYGRFIADYNSYPYAFPYKAGSNMGFSYNATCDSLITKLWFQNSTGKQQYYSELADWAQNYQYPMLYLGNDLTGRAMDKDWDVAWVWRWVLHFDLVKYSPTAPPPIPGFSVGLVLFTSLIASIGIAYIFMRKKKIL